MPAAERQSAKNMTAWISPVARRVAGRVSLVLGLGAVGALACNGGGALAAPSAGATPPARILPHPSIPAPLASQSLLLGAAWAGSRLVAVGDRGHILLSDDQGAHWRQAPSPSDATLTAVHFIDARQGWAVGHDATILRTRDGGETWTLQNFKPDWEQPLMDVLFDDATHGIAIGAYGLFMETTDGGDTWTRRKVGDEDMHLNAIFALPTAQDTATLVMVGESGSVLVSRDRGQTWTPSPTNYTGSFFGGVALGPADFLVFGLQGHVLRTRDGGGSWQEIATGTKAGLMGGTRDARGDVVIVGALGAMLISRDGGQTFHLTERPDRTAESRALVLDADGKGTVLLFGGDGLRRSALAPAAVSGG